MKIQSINNIYSFKGQNNNVQNNKNNNDNKNLNKIGIPLTALLLTANTILGTMLVKDAIKNKPKQDETPKTSISGETSHEMSELEKELEVQEILANNPEVKTAYDYITQSIKTFSSQLGEDGLALIKKETQELTNGEISPIEVLKVLQMESWGNIYSDENPNEILRSNADAYGAFQITPLAEKQYNQDHNLIGTGKELDKKDPYDNLKIGIYTLQLGRKLRKQQLQNGETLPTGDNLNRAMVWSYHDGAWADRITNYGEIHLEKYDKLSVLDKYPQVIEHILEGGN